MSFNGIQISSYVRNVRCREWHKSRGFWVNNRRQHIRSVRIPTLSIWSHLDGIMSFECPDPWQPSLIPKFYKVRSCIFGYNNFRSTLLGIPTLFSFSNSVHLLSRDVFPQSSTQKLTFGVFPAFWTPSFGISDKGWSIDQNRIPLIAQKVGQDKISIHGDLTSLAQLSEVLEHFWWFWGVVICFKVSQDW